jgi:hypothetical protein
MRGVLLVLFSPSQLYNIAFPDTTYFFEYYFLRNFVSSPTGLNKCQEGDTIVHTKCGYATLTEALLARVELGRRCWGKFVPTASMTVAEPHQHQPTTFPTATHDIASPSRPLYIPNPATQSACLKDARHNSRDAVTRDSQRLGCAARAPLRRRPLRPPSEGNKKARSRRASGTERWQERAGFEQLRGYVGPQRLVCRLAA